MHLSNVEAPTSASPHSHSVTGPPRWRHAAQLLPAIDRHGWIDDYRPLSTRSIGTRVTLLSTRALAASRSASTDVASAHHENPRSCGLVQAGASLDEVLALLDQVAGDADAVNKRIQAPLTDSPRNGT
jgi:hypothetical protein